MEKYRPINCTFHDHLEAWATTKTTCGVKFMDSYNKKTFVNGKIKDIYTSEGNEFMVLDDGTKIRLDSLVSVNGKQLKNYC